MRMIIVEVRDDRDPRCDPSKGEIGIVDLRDQWSVPQPRNTAKFGNVGTDKCHRIETGGGQRGCRQRCDGSLAVTTGNPDSRPRGENRREEIGSVQNRSRRAGGRNLVVGARRNGCCDQCGARFQVCRAVFRIDADSGLVKGRMTVGEPGTITSVDICTEMLRDNSERRHAASRDAKEVKLTSGQRRKVLHPTRVTRRPFEGHFVTVRDNGNSSELTCAHAVGFGEFR